MKKGIFARNINLTAQLLCMHNASSHRVSIKKITPEKYSLSFTPQERGKHELHIKYNDEHICGSPVPINISIQPDQLKVTSIKEVNDVGGIKCHEGKIYACKSQKDAIVILDSLTEHIERTIRVCEVLIDNHHIYATDDITQRWT